MSFRDPIEGELLRDERSSALYLIKNRRRLRLPNDYVCEAFGLDPRQATVVGAEVLNSVAIDDPWAPLGARTPGSCVFTSEPVGILGTNRVYWPVPLPNARHHVAWGQEAWTSELRGWLQYGGPNPGDPDFAYELELDVRWALQEGIPLNIVLRLGNILGIGEADPSPAPRAWCARPRIKLEISGHPPKTKRDRRRPPDWTFQKYHWNGQPVYWPFDPEAPPPTHAAIKGKPYVRVYGAIVTDQSHMADFKDKATRDAASMWSTDNEKREGDQARWVEVHPPDWIEALPDEPRAQTLRGVAVVAPGIWSGNPRSNPRSTLDTTILAPPAPSPSATLRILEIVGPETNPSSIVDGNETLTGAKITQVSDPDGFRIGVTVEGQRGVFGGTPGKFRALYWLFWEMPGEPSIVPPASDPTEVTCVSISRGRGRRRIGGIGGTNNDGSSWLLSPLGAHVAMQAGRSFYVEGIDGPVPLVAVTTRRGRRYVRTKSDKYLVNNLAKLPKCLD
jgi:Protein of unknown function (DUF3892)